MELVDGVVVAMDDERLRQAQGHRRVVGPLPWQELERPPADHVGDGRKRAGLPELHRRAHGVAGGEPEKGAPGPIAREIGIAWLIVFAHRHDSSRVNEYVLPPLTAA